MGQNVCLPSIEYLESRDYFAFTVQVEIRAVTLWEI